MQENAFHGKKSQFIVTSVTSPLPHFDATEHNCGLTLVPTHGLNGLPIRFLFIKVIFNTPFIHLDNFL